MFGRTCFHCYVSASHQHRYATPASFAYSLRKIVAAVSLCTIIGVGASANTTQDVGLRVGDKAPSFSLKDQNGNDVSLDSLIKKGPVALLFFRSADWCLSCELQLIKLQRHVKEFEAAGGQLVGISYDSPKTLKCFADKRSITIPILSDTGSKTIDAYGVREARDDLASKGVARHVIIVVDRKGVIRAKRFGVIYDERPGVEAVVNALKEAQKSLGATP